MGARSCAIISHRPTRFKFKYKETMSGCKRLKKRLQDQCMALYGHGVRRFYVGGCLGVDQWVGEILLQMAKQTDFTGIELVVVEPFPGHDKDWDERSQRRQRFLIDQSTEHLVIGQDDRPESFMARNRYMLNHADVLLAVYDNNRAIRSGVGLTVSSAEKRGVPVVLIHPDTGIISIQGNHPQQTNQFVLVDFPSE